MIFYLEMICFTVRSATWILNSYCFVAMTNLFFSKLDFHCKICHVRFQLYFVSKISRTSKFQFVNAFN